MTFSSSVIFASVARAALRASSSESIACEVAAAKTASPAASILNVIAFIMRIIPYAAARVSTPKFSA